MRVRPPPPNMLSYWLWRESCRSWDRTLEGRHRKHKGGGRYFNLCTGVWSRAALASSASVLARGTGPCAITMLAIQEERKLLMAGDHLVVF